MTARFAIEPLSQHHDRSGFACGNDRIDGYFRQAVSQDVRRRYATCFVARELSTDMVAGFYTLSSGSVLLADVPADIARKLPRYPTVPAVLIGWLGRDLRFAGSGLGQALLFDAIRTVADARIGVYAVFADAIDEAAARFYEGFGFIPLVDRPHRLFLPIAQVLPMLTKGP